MIFKFQKGCKIYRYRDPCTTKVVGEEIKRIVVGIEVKDGIMLPKEIHVVLTWYFYPRPRRSILKKNDNIIFISD